MNDSSRAFRRVLVTGMGVISALGRGRDAHLDAIRDARSGITWLQRFDASEFICRVAGQVPDDALQPEEFRGYDRFSRLALAAAGEAASQARLDDPNLDRHRIATLIGTGLGGCESLDAGYERLYGRGSSRIPPFTIPRSMYNAAASAISATHRAEGPAFGVVSACASATHALGQAMLWIRSGLADVVLAGGADAPLVPGIVRAWEGLRVLASPGDHPSGACRPFSADRAGLVLAEGAAVLVLESEESARRRGVEALGEIAGFGLSSDAGHLTDPSAEGAARAIEMALHDGGIEPSAVGYVNAHGTATRANDPAETRALKIALGPHVERIPVSSTKSAHGHAMGASGAIEAAISLLSLNEMVIPATLHYRQPDPDCDLDVVPNEPRSGRVSLFLSSSFGFGGMNGVLAIRTMAGIATT